MNHKLFTLSLAAAALFSFAFAMPKAAYADFEGDKTEYKRDVEERITKLKNKIAELKEDYKEKGQEVDMEVKKYEDEIDAIQRESNEKLDSMDQDYDQANWDKDKTDIDARISDVTKNFHEWRLDRAIAGYAERIGALKQDVEAETDAEEKKAKEAKLQKLEAKYDAVQSKKADLAATQGANWDQINEDLDKTLHEIDADLDAWEDAHDDDADAGEIKEDVEENTDTDKATE